MTQFRASAAPRFSGHRSYEKGTNIYENSTQESRNGEIRKGALLISSSMAVFIVCSVIQGVAGSSMFSSSYRADINAILDFLVNVTFYPGWIATALLLLYGVLTLLPEHKNRDQE